MKLFAHVFLLLLISGCCYAQRVSQPGIIFKRTEYVNQKPCLIFSDTVEANNEKVDIIFFHKHFHQPYYLPGKFIDKRYKDTVVSQWFNDKAKKDFYENQEYNYWYDSLSRVTSYAYSGCLICANLPYGFTVTYNTQNQVASIFDNIYGKNGYRFYYDNAGQVEQFDYYGSQQLTTRWTLVK